MSFRQLARCAKRQYSSAATSRLHELPRLSDATVDTFRANAFTPAVPAILPRGHFISYPAVSKWFDDPGGRRPRLKTEYLETHDGSVIVPLEVTNTNSPKDTMGDADRQRKPEFTRTEQPLSMFLSLIAHQQSILDPGKSPGAQQQQSPLPQVYLAQCPLPDLPSTLQRDLPTPDLVLQSGRGDVYASSIWLGLAPTLTPLHKDPNPNLFVQLAGRKALRVFEPAVGAELFARAKVRVSTAPVGGLATPSLRGEEMMQGAEKEALDEIVWDDGEDDRGLASGYEAVVGPGDCLFIPKGWWHSFKGMGQGIVGSVNWWFR